MTLLVLEQNFSFARQCTDRVYSIVNWLVGFDGGCEQFVAQGGLIGSH